MWAFRRRIGLEPPPRNAPDKKCDHKWTDIRVDDQECWYLSYEVKDDDYGIDHTLSYTIFEPYVCIHCKERKNVILEGPYKISVRSNKGAWEELDSIRAKYPQIKDRAVVEDAVNDFQLIDREYLRAAACVMGVKI